MVLETDIQDLKDDSRRKSKTILLLGAVIIGLVMLLAAVVTNRPSSEVLALTVDGRILPLPVLSEPFHSTERVLAWTADCIERAYSMSFADIKEHPSRLACIQPEIRRQFIDQLNSSGIINKVVDEKRVLRAVRRASPSLQKEGVSQGRYLWSVQMPLQLNFEGHANIERSNITVSVVIGRVDLHAAEESGLAVGRIEWVRGGQ